jgi:hypothetical protein
MDAFSESARECVALSRAVFACDPSPAVSAAYAAAHATVLTVPDGRPTAAAEDRMIADAIRRGWDLEALELAWRMRDRHNRLTRRVGILFYLVETTPEGSRRFVNRRDQRVRGLAVMAGHVLRSAFLWTKGTVLSRRIGAA